MGLGPKPRGAFAARMLLVPPDPLLNGVWAGAPTQRGPGGKAPSYILAAKPPRGLGRAPAPCEHDSIKPLPTGLVSPRGAKFV